MFFFILFMAFQVLESWVVLPTFASWPCVVSFFMLAQTKLYRIGSCWAQIIKLAILYFQRIRRDLDLLNCQAGVVIIAGPWCWCCWFPHKNRVALELVRLAPACSYVSWFWSWRCGFPKMSWCPRLGLRPNFIVTREADSNMYNISSF